jgi:hypothetical protein
MGLFKQIAEPLIARNVPVIPLRPRSKIAFLQGWESLASTDPTKIEQWDQEYVDANAACVAYARPEGIWIFEVDKPGLLDEIEKETGQTIPETFTIRSSPGKGHLYLRQNEKSIAMGNRQGKNENGKESWSARVDNRYCVAPGSFHPNTGKKYEVLRDVPIIEAPDWLIQWCVSQSKTDQPIQQTGHVELDSQELIVEGGRNNALTSLAGKARQVLGLDKEELFQYLLSQNQKRCKPPLPESEVRTISYSVGKYPVVESGSLVFEQPVVEETIQPVMIEPVPFPTFPRWCIRGTSIEKGLISPICAKNNSYQEFLFMPAIVLMMNYLALKVTVKDKLIIPSFYLINIGWKGRAFKSQSTQDAIDYFTSAGMAGIATGATRNAEGKSLIWTAGSIEGVGIEAARTACKNLVLFYDEFSTLVDKASIEKSSLMSNILSMYESRQFANSVKSRKESYVLEAGKYCMSLIANTTDKGFTEQWARLPKTNDSGMLDRFFFLYQPETQLGLKPHVYVNTSAGAFETRKLVDLAVQQGLYSFTDETIIENEIEKIGTRGAKLAEKMALYFAVDMGKSEIDESCIERAIAIVKYGIAVKKYLHTFESSTKEGQLQQEIIYFLRRKNGVTTERELNRAMHPMKYGTFVWSRALMGLVNSGWITKTGSGVKNDPAQIVLMRLPETEEE